MKMKSIISTVFALMMAVSPIFADSVKGDVSSSNSGESSDITIHASYSTIRVQNAANKQLYVYDLTGNCKNIIKIDSNDKTISFGNLQKCIYIMKIGEVVRKISIK